MSWGVPLLWMYGLGAGAGSSPHVLHSPAGFRSAVRSGVVVGEVAGQLAVGVGLGQEVFGLLLDSGDGVGAGHPAQRRLVLACELDQGVGELGGVTSLLAV